MEKKEMRYFMHLGEECVIKGSVHDLHLSKPEVHVDNKQRERSGHMTHALLETTGKVWAFNSNCSAVRCGGHSAFGFVEYRISEDGGDHFGEIQVLPFSWKSLMDGLHTVSVEKAVACGDGSVVAFCLRNSQENELCYHPLGTPAWVRTMDGGKTWTEEQYFPFAGRIYDAMYHEGSIYMLEFCNDVFQGTSPEHVYRLYKSDDNGISFYEHSIVEFPSTLGLGYGNMIFDQNGRLIVYAYDMNDEVNMTYAVSNDNGLTWQEWGKSYVAKKIRNPQVGILDDQFILHGRAGEHNFVIYTSADGIHWDEGHYLDEVEGEQYGGCYYSNNIVLDHPHKPGKKRMLVQYSEVYKEPAVVDVMHMWIESEE